MLNMKVRTFMRVNPLVLYEDNSLQDAVDIFIKKKMDGLPVLNGRDQVVGMVTRSHVFKLLAGKIDSKTKINGIQASKTITINPEESIENLIKWNVSCLPVVENNKLVGIVNLSDTIQAYYDSAIRLQLQLNAVINSVHNGIFSIDENGVIQLFNPASQRALGVTSKKAIGKKINDILPNTTLTNALKTGTPEFGQKAHYNHQTFISNRTPIINDGIVIGAVEVIQDLSELEALSQELVYTKQLKDKMSAIINSSFDGIIVTNSDGEIIRTNDASIRILGESSINSLGKNITEANAHEVLFAKHLFNKVIETNNSVTISHQLSTGNDILVTANPIISTKGAFSGVVFNVRDITELSYLREKISSLNELYNKQLIKDELLSKFIFKSPMSMDMMDLVFQVAPVDSTVLILGESGVGKEIIANILQSNSTRFNKPFIRINCGAIPDNLLESELFGYEAGAFTGAQKGGKMGLFEVAHHGTIFLDEIGEIPIMLQVKLLRVLQECEITRIGGSTPHKIDVRIIAATNRNLKEMVDNGKFRKDLYYRLNVVQIYVPALRQRKEEIPDLINYFFKKFNKKFDMNKKLDQTILEQLINYYWPGNIRELENLIERAIVTTNGNIINKIKLPNNPEKLNPISPDFINNGTFEGSSLKSMVDEYEKQLIIKAIKKYGTTRKIASMLGVDQSTIVRKASRLGISLDRNTDD